MLCDARPDYPDYHGTAWDTALPLCQVYQEKMPTQASYDNWPATGGCLEGWTQFGKGCFKLFGGNSAASGTPESEWKTWTNAEMHCQSQASGGHLAVSRLKQLE